MTCRLVHVPPPLAGARDVGENVFLSDLSAEYSVFVFYYPGAMPDPDLEDVLRRMGAESGGNVFVNIGRLNDPAFSAITKVFDIDSYPVVVITGTPHIVSPDDSFLSSFVRVDNRRLLGAPDRAVHLVQELSTLFLRGDVAKAMKRAKRLDRRELIGAVTGAIGRGLKHLVGFVADRDIAVSVAEGKFELKKSGA